MKHISEVLATLPLLGGCGGTLNLPYCCLDTSYFQYQNCLHAECENHDDDCIVNKGEFIATPDDLEIMQRCEDQWLVQDL